MLWMTASFAALGQWRPPVWHISIGGRVFRILFSKAASKLLAVFDKYDVFTRSCFRNVDFAKQNSFKIVMPYSKCQRNCFFVNNAIIMLSQN